MTRTHHTRARRTRLSSAVALTALVTAALLGPPAASYADDGGITPATSAQCATGKVCLWSAAFYGGSFFSTSSTTTVNVGVFTVARSVWNNSSKAAYVYSGSGGSGSSTCLLPGSTTTSTTLSSGSVRVSSSGSC